MIFIPNLKLCFVHYGESNPDCAHSCPNMIGNYSTMLVMHETMIDSLAN